MSRDKNDCCIPLRLRYPAAFNRLLEMLRLGGLNAYDVISEVAGPTQAGEVVVRIRYGHSYGECTERIFHESLLVTLDDEVLAFFQEIATHCQQQSISDYRTFMGRTRP